MSNKRSALLRMKDELKKSLQVPFKVKKDRKQLESWIIDRELEIAKLNEEIDELKGAENLDVDAILYKVDDLRLATKKLEQGEELLDELFEAPYEQTEEE